MERGVHTWYQACCRTSRKARTWKARQVRIWVRTEKSSGAEMSPEGGRWDTSSLQAGFRLTGEEKEEGKEEGPVSFHWFSHLVS